MVTVSALRARFEGNYADSDPITQEGLDWLRTTFEALLDYREAVLKIHRPHTPYDPLGITAPRECCTHCYLPYPCATAKAAGWTPEETV